MKSILDFFLHVDKNLIAIVAAYGAWSYVILFGVIFMETGLVVTPFLPGDSLLFAAGALSAMGSFNLTALFLLMWLAAFLGDTVNYWIGHYIGPRAFEMNNKLLKKEYLEKAQSFYDKHGGKAIVLARFVPIVRTFAPFVAGIGKMSYGKFISYNLIGGLAWVSVFVFGGYFFGNLPFIRDNFHYSVVVIVLISVVPIVMEIVKSKRKENKAI
jgi:membrane-associated protein